MDNQPKKKILTISIPTWNRANYLRELLEQLTTQVTQFKIEGRVEVLVSNNNSSDDTEEVVNGFISKNDFIVYNRNSENIGAKSNMIKSMELASSEYVLVLGDDDRMRKDALPEILNLLESRKSTGILIDSSLAAKKKIVGDGEISLINLIQNYYWQIGNAGIFIMRSEFIKNAVAKIDYSLFNECWPQTQIMILGISDNHDQKCYRSNLNIHAMSIHDEVMVYNSFYLWRTCYLELVRAINSIRDLIPGEIYSAARSYVRGSIFQQLFNILQCGVFIDKKDVRRKTRTSIMKNISLFSFFEQVILVFIAIVLSLPTFVSKPLANIFIFVIRGNKGLQKKNEFVKAELEKEERMQSVQNGSIRTLQFEAEN